MDISSDLTEFGRTPVAIILPAVIVSATQHLVLILKKYDFILSTNLHVCARKFITLAPNVVSLQSKWYQMDPSVVGL